MNAAIKIAAGTVVAVMVALVCVLIAGAFITEQIIELARAGLKRRAPVMAWDTVKITGFKQMVLDSYAHWVAFFTARFE